MLLIRILATLGALFIATIVAFIVFQYFSVGANFMNVGNGVLIKYVGIPLYGGLFLGRVFFVIARTASAEIDFNVVGKELLRGRDTYLTILVSPLVVMAILTFSDGGVDTFTTIVLSFQNGFFMQNVVTATIGGSVPTIKSNSG